MAQSNRLTDLTTVVSLVGTKFWDAVMGGGQQPVSAMGPAISDPEPTVVLGGESHIHVDDRIRCEEACYDCEHDLDGCVE